MRSQTSIVSDADLDFVSGGDKNAKGQTVPHRTQAARRQYTCRAALFINSISDRPVARSRRAS